MTRPTLDYAVLGGRRWAWAAGCWREWSNTHADWLPSDPPPEAMGLTTYEPAAGAGGFLVKIHNSTTAPGQCSADDDRRAETPEPHEDCPVSCPGPLGHRPSTPDQP